MKSLRAVRMEWGVIAGLAVVAGGCLYAGGEAPDTAGLGRLGLGVGVTGGWTVEADPDLDSDTYLGGQVSYWFNELVAARIGFGSSTFDDSNAASPGKLRVSPVLCSAVISLPPAETRKDSAFRWAAGFGGGVLTFKHSDVSDPSALPILAFHGGGEWILTQKVGRVFAVTDVIMGDFVKVAGENRDLTWLITLRGGLEITF
jgi:hypothetical protein